MSSALLARKPCWILFVQGAETETETLHSCCDLIGARYMLSYSGDIPEPATSHCLDQIQFQLIFTYYCL